MPSKLRCAVIGTGAIGLDHLQSLAVDPRADVVAIAETDPGRCKEACDRFKIRRSYSDYLELLDQPDIDAVTIALPNYLHAKVAMDALKARKHVLLEKPLATSARDAAKIVAMARKARRTFLLGVSFRFHPHAQTAKALLERGELGDIYHVRGFWLRRNGIPKIGSWFTQKEFSGGGCTYDVGLNLLDAILHLVGEFNVQSVSALTHARLGPLGLGAMVPPAHGAPNARSFNVEDYSVALLRLKSGRSIILEAGWAAFIPPDRREFGIDLLGTKGGLSLFPARLFRNGPDGYETVNLTPTKLPWSEDRVHHFVSCVLDNQKPLVTLDQALKVQQVLDAIYASDKSKKEVRLS